MLNGVVEVGSLAVTVTHCTCGFDVGFSEAKARVKGVERRIR